MRPESRPRRMYFVFAAVAVVVSLALAWRAAADPWGGILYLPTAIAFSLVAVALIVLGALAERRTRRATP